MAMLAASLGTCVFGFCEEESDALVDSDAIAVYRVPKESSEDGTVAYRAARLFHSEGAIIDGTPSYFRSDEFQLVLKEAAAVVLPLERIAPLRLAVMLCVPALLVAAVLGPLLFVVLLAQVVDPDEYPLGVLYLLILPFVLVLCLPLLYVMRKYIMAPRRAAETFIVGTNKDMVPQGLMVSFDKRTDYISANGVVYTSLVFYVDTSIWTETVPSTGAEKGREATGGDDSGGDDDDESIGLNESNGESGGRTKQQKSATRDYRILQEVDPWA